MGLQFAVRSISRRWAASAAVVGVVGLSAALTIALFAVVDGLLFKPLPFPEPDRLVAVGYRLATNGSPPQLAYRPEFASRREALRKGLDKSPLVETSAQAGFAQFFDHDTAQDAGLEVTGVDSRFFVVLGLHPEVGVGFDLDDERNPATRDWASGLALPIVVGDALAKRAFGSAAAALGVHDLAGRHVRVVGVMPPGVKFPGETNVWAPVASDRDRPPSYARLGAHASVLQLAGEFPDLEITVLRDSVRIGSPQALEILFIASVLLLLLTWTQVSALTLSASLADSRQLGVMLALGASQARLARQAATQNALLIAAAFLLAWMIIPNASALIIGVIPSQLRHGQYLWPDSRTLAFGSLLAVTCFGLLTIVPTVLIARAAPLRVLNGWAGSRGSSADRWRRWLLALQMGATAFLLYLSALTMHSFVRATSFDYGFDPDNLLLFTPPLNWASSTASATENLAAFDRFEDKIGATMTVLGGMKEVDGVAGFFKGPFGTGASGRPYDISAPVTSFGGRPRPDVIALCDDVTSSFVNTLRVRLVAGHDFEASIATRGTTQVIVNRTLAEQLVGVGSAVGPAWASVIGQDLHTVMGGGRVVGVIDDLVLGTPEMPGVPEFFELGKNTASVAELAIRAPTASLPSVRAALERLWGPVSPHLLEPMDSEWARVMAPYRSQALLLGLLALAGLPVAGLGITGALLDAVRLRKQEIAVRLVVGANLKNLWAIVFKQTLGSVGLGVVLGSGAGAAAGLILRSQLFHVQPVDPLTVFAVATGITGVAGVAAIMPAMHARRVDPSALLRSI